MPVSEVDTVTADELEALMKEFPDWKEQFPEINQSINPPRYSKLTGKHGGAQGDQVIVQKRGVSMPKSDYQQTYRHHRAYRPRSTKKPPPSPREQNPPPMSLQTNQRKDFTPKDLGVRAELVKMEEQYEKPEGAFEGTSHYQRDYPGHFSLPELRLKPANAGQLGRSSGKFESQTTTNEHYKQWRTKPSRPFGELPSFTGSILYPEHGHCLETTTGQTFKGAPGKRADLIKLGDANIKLEGDIDMQTTHKDTFHQFSNAQRATKVTHKPSVVVDNRSKFAAESQSKHDFPGFHRGQPRPPKPSEPAPSTIDLKFNNQQVFATEQRNQFSGIDTRHHPVAKSCKKEDESYKTPDVKFATTTSQKMDYQPIDIESIYKPPVRPPPSKLSETKPKMDDHTMNKHFFKKWDVKQRVRYGDFHEGHAYVPPAERFDSKTTNQDVFKVPKATELRPSFKPEDTSIDNQGDHDFNTMYKVTFSQPKAAKKLPKHQAMFLLGELRKRKYGRQPGVHALSVK